MPLARSRRIAALLALALAAGGLGAFGELRDDCAEWRAGYRDVLLMLGRRNMPLIEREVLEETVARYGPLPPFCEAPAPYEPLGVPD